jgi:hypothetical protein
VPVEVLEKRDEDAELEDEGLAVDRELEEIVAAGDESADSHLSDQGLAPTVAPRPKPDIASARSMPGDDVQGLLAKLQIRQKPDGGVSIDAPPEAAATLATLFEQMAKLLRAQS